ncbi:MAG: glycosyltransferase family 2 protein [Bacteroidales bacterium]|jgi:GT2 family glycosyltransferase|nr:glycosyltransferase family 2 protein [Bacteroidales bacterium]
MSKLSIVIVNYNVCHFIEQCLVSVRRATRDLDTEIFVVDNASTDDSVTMLRERFPEVKLIVNQENVGFSKANNQAMTISTGEFVLLLNPDTVIGEDTLSLCLHFMECTPDAGAVGVKMINGKGEFLRESKRGLPLPSVAFYKIFGLASIFPRSHRFGSYHLSYLNENEINEIEILSGAFMCMRREALKKSGLLDEDYFMYGEDIDLSYRILKAGYKNYYYPATKIIHYKGESTKKGSLNYVYVFYRAMQIFACKHFAAGRVKMFNLLINIAIWFRAGLSILKRAGQILAFPLIDFIVIYGGLFVCSRYWETAVLSLRNSTFPATLYQIVLPFYILLWLVSIGIFKGYQQPFQFSRTCKGILGGCISILLIYALLPESFRFSRAIILIGSGWTLISLNVIRYLYCRSRGHDYFANHSRRHRIAIIGSDEEFARVHALAKQLYPQVNYVAWVSTDNDIEKNAVVSFSPITLLSDLQKSPSLLNHIDIQEVIFCSKNLKMKQIIDFMETWKDLKINYKIAPENSSCLIGSNSIACMDSESTLYPHALHRPEIYREKRIFDLCCVVFLFLISPIHILFVKNKKKYLKNLCLIGRGEMSFVSYYETKGLVSPAIGISTREVPEPLKKNLQEMYQNDYHVIYDLKIFWFFLRERIKF